MINHRFYVEGVFIIWYVGGKIRLSKIICPIIQSDITKNTSCFVDLFCGGCNIIDKIRADIRIANDSNAFLIEMWKSLVSGWFPDDLQYTKEYYDYVKHNKDVLPKELVGLVGFHYSYGGKFFGGFARSRYSDHIKRSIEHTMQQSKNLTGVLFLNECYDNVNFPENALVYCDPPYKNSTQSSTKYGNTNFDYEKFWNWCNARAKNNTVYVSETSVPDRFVNKFEIKNSSNMCYKKTTGTVEYLVKIQ